MQTEFSLPQQILAEACEKFGYQFRILEEISKDLSEISDGKKSFFNSPLNGRFPLNSHSVSNLVTNKAWTYKILSQNGYQVPAGESFWLKNSSEEITKALEFARKLEYPVFVKPNDSLKGILADWIEDQEQLEKHLQKISAISENAIIQKAFDLPEFRIFAIDGEPKFAYRRIMPMIVGDGQKNIQELLENLNNRIEIKVNIIDENSLFLQKQFKKFGFDFQTILKVGEHLQVSSKSNLAAGAEISEFTQEFSEKTKIWVKKISELFQIRITGIDVFTKSDLNDPEDFYVIELNHNPGLSGIYKHGEKEVALNLWGEILDKYFNPILKYDL